MKQRIAMLQAPKKWDAANKKVTCKKCGESYICTPSSDYYNFTNANDGVCESCLLAGSNPHMN